MSYLTERRVTRKLKRGLACTATTAAAIALAIAPAGCGNGSKTASASAPQTASPSVTATGTKSVGATIAQGAWDGKPSRGMPPPVPRHSKQPIRAVIVPSAESVEAKQAAMRAVTLKAQGPNPCGFISRAAAQSAIGSPIASEQEDPMGPTCVFTLTGQRQTITMAVEASNAAHQETYMSKRQPVTLGGHQGYCGVLGRPMLDVSLTKGRVFNITAPCPVAQALATSVLPYITTP